MLVRNGREEVMLCDDRVLWVCFEPKNPRGGAKLAMMLIMHALPPCLSYCHYPSPVHHLFDKLPERW